MSEVRSEALVRLGRDLDALTGAGLLLEVSAHDAEFTPVMLRLVVRHAEFAAQRARLLLADVPPSSAGAARRRAGGGG